MKDYHDSIAMKLEFIVETIDTLIPLFKSRKRNWKKTLASAQRDLFYSSLSADDWKYLNDPTPKSSYTKDEVFGRVNIVHKIIECLDQGLSINLTVEFIRPFLIRCHLPKEKRYIKHLEKEMSLNTYMSHYYQNVDIRDIEWNESFRGEFLSGYRKELERLGFLI